MPSAATPALTRANADGRLPVARCSSLRSSISLTGALAALASRAQISPWASGPNLLPKPPPMNSVITRTLACGILRPQAKPSRVPCTACVETHAVRLLAVPLADAAVRLERRVRLHLRRVGAFDEVAPRLSGRRRDRLLLRRCRVRVLPGSKTLGASGRIACSTVARCGSTSQSTSIRRMASAACCSVSAATAAISSPAYITF